MKAVLLTRSHQEPLADVPQAAVLTDSALVITPKPVFVPEVAAGYSLAVCPAVRISRLGKYIAPRFATRYFSEIAPVVRLLPDGDPYPASGLLIAGDCMAAEGSFSAWNPGDRLEIVISGTLMPEPLRLEITQESLMMNETIASVSRFMTLKNGDLIAPCSIKVPITDSTKLIDSSLEVSLNSNQSSFRFK